MARLLVIYNYPENPEAFNSYYRETHMPIFDKVPGVRSLSFSAGAPEVVAGAPVYLVVEVAFDSMRDLRAALASPEGQAAAADLANYAQAGVTILAYDQSPEPQWS